MLSQNKKLIKNLVTFFGAGLAPKAPGTFGSLGGLLLVLILSLMPWYIYFSSSLIICALGLWATNLYLDSVENKDPKEVVIDEVVGILFAFLLVPISLASVLVGFLLFRFFDILKPPPISFFDKKVPGSTGVMADDIVAGFIVNMLFHFYILPSGFLNKISAFLN